MTKIDPVGFGYGFNEFLRRDPSPTSMALARRFDFNTDCLYGAIKAGSDQIETIEDFFSRSGHSVDYLLYNPPTVPLSVAYPIVSRLVVENPPPLGCRVVSRTHINETLAGFSMGESPSLSQLAAKAGSAGLRVEDWISDLLKCKAGKQYDAVQESDILPIIERRTGPIGAAIAVSIELPRDL